VKYRIGDLGKNYIEEMFNAETFTALYLKKFELRLGVSGTVYMADNTPLCDIVQLSRDIGLNHTSLRAWVKKNHGDKVPPLSKPLFLDALSTLVDDIRIADRQKATELAKPCDLALIDTVPTIRHFLKSISTDHLGDLYVYQFANMLCQIKRRVLGLSSAPMIHIFYGTQGLGKTYFFERMQELLGSLCGGLKVNEVIDTRYYQQLGHMAVNFSDEMGGISKVDMAALKSVISEGTKSCRPLGTNLRVDVNTGITLIGTTNQFPHEIAKDPTGARRFMFYPWDKSTRHIEFDIVQMFREVQHEDKTYYSDKVAAEKQEFDLRHTATDPWEQFAVEHKIDLNREYRNKLIKTQDLYREFQMWCTNAGKSFLSREHFLKNLQFKYRLYTYHNSNLNQRLTVVTEETAKNLRLTPVDESLVGKVLPFKKDE
jgi:hypothetical protein